MTNYIGYVVRAGEMRQITGDHVNKVFHQRHHRANKRGVSPQRLQLSSLDLR